MKRVYTIVLCAVVIMMASCGQTTPKDNPANADTMVMQKNQTDSATNGISTDTTKK